MSKNIVILLDGTSNEISADRTNILRLYGTLEKSERQLVYYDPGVGTFGAEGAWLRTSRKLVELWGLATGWGLDQNVKEAYRFLVENYERGEGEDEDRDRIYIFGFSRGAYTARALAGFIHAVGLIEKRNLNLVDYAYRAFKRIGENSDDSFAEVRLYERILDPDRPPIRLLGLFDTVASVIEHGRYGPRLRTHAFTRTNRSVETVRHAVAIHERRTMFLPQLWPEGGEYWGNPFNRAAAREQDAREVWFTGAHGDIGGGYPEQKAQLAKVALKWMIEQTEATGLHFRSRTVKRIVLEADPKKPYVAPDGSAEPYDSMNWAWSILEFLPRRKPPSTRRRSFLGLTIPFFEPRVIPENARIHRSVIECAEAKGEKPSNLPDSYRVED